MKVPESLDDILDTALRNNATRVSIEYDSAGDLEVMYYVGTSGVGVSVSSDVEKQRIISELVDRSGLEKRPTGTIRLSQNGKVVVVRVSGRDHFGESAFDLRFGV